MNQTFLPFNKLPKSFFSSVSLSRLGSEAFAISTWGGHLVYFVAYMCVKRVFIWGILGTWSLFECAPLLLKIKPFFVNFTGPIVAYLLYETKYNSMLSFFFLGKSIFDPKKVRRQNWSFHNVYAWIQQLHIIYIT